MNDGERNTLDRRGRPRGLTGGLILILLGVVFLLQQTGRFDLRNWWALFILLPAVGSFATTYALYRRFNAINQAVASNFFGAVMILAVAGMFLFDLSWATYWPIFVILPGLSILLGGLLAGQPGDFRPRTLQLFAGPWLVGLGLGALLLGTAFLLANLALFDPATYLGPRWWSLPILVFACGGLVATLRLSAEHGRSGLAVLSSLAAAVIVAAVGIMGYLAIDWNLLWPVTLIAAGCVLLLGVLGGRSRLES